MLFVSKKLDSSNMLDYYLPNNYLSFILKSVMLLSGRPSGWGGPTSRRALGSSCLALYSKIKPRASHGRKGPAACATRPCASCLASCAPTPRASHGHTRPTPRLVPRAAHLARASRCLPRQLPTLDGNK